MAKENKKPTKEEIKKREKLREISLINLKSSLWDYALPKFITPAQYGQIAEMAKSNYAELISNAPKQDVYEKLFLPQLANEGGAVTSPYLQNTSARILQESLFSVKVQDVLDYFGSNRNIKGDYSEKYVSELNEEEAKAVVGTYIEDVTDQKVSELFQTSRQSRKENLENILCEEDKKKK